MHAKYDVLENACNANYFETPYFAWVDVGLFRNLDGTDYPLFKLIPPEKFHPERIGFSQAWPHDPAHSLEDIMHNKMVWVSGSMVLATKEVSVDAVEFVLEKSNSVTCIRMFNNRHWCSRNSFVSICSTDKHWC